VIVPLKRESARGGATPALVGHMAKRWIAIEEKEGARGHARKGLVLCRRNWFQRVALPQEARQIHVGKRAVSSGAVAHGGRPAKRWTSDQRFRLHAFLPASSSTRARQVTSFALRPRRGASARVGRRAGPYFAAQVVPPAVHFPSAR